MSFDSFQTMDVSTLRRAISQIHQQVVSRSGRVEVTRPGCDDVCVIISRAELESLEQALEILASTEAYKSMCDSVAQLAAACGAPSAVQDASA